MTDVDKTNLFQVNHQRIVDSDGFELDGIIYRDNRMVVFTVARCYLSSPDHEDMVTSTIFYEKKPSRKPKQNEKHVWALIVFQNTTPYRVLDLFHFKKKKDAKEYLWKIEFSTPFVTMGGNSFVYIGVGIGHSIQLWEKTKKGYYEEGIWKDFDCNDLKAPGGSDLQQTIVTAASSIEVKQQSY